MLFEKLIKQHRVHCLISDRVGLPLVIPRHKIGIGLRHIFSHQPELWDAVRIKLVFVTEGHWLQRQDRFARLVHRMDMILVAGGGSNGAKLTGCAHDNWYTCWNGCST